MSTTKQLSKRDSAQVLQAVFNEADKTLTTAGFIDAKVGHKITRTIVDSTTDDFRYFDVSQEYSVAIGPMDTTITVSNHNITVGSYVFIPNIFPANTVVTAVTSTTITVSEPAATSHTGAMKIGKLLKRIRIIYDASRSNIDDTERVE
jgi:hypothetical protein